MKRIYEQESWQSCNAILTFTSTSSEEIPAYEGIVKFSSKYFCLDSDDNIVKACSKIAGNKVPQPLVIMVKINLNSEVESGFVRYVHDGQFTRSISYLIIEKGDLVKQ